MAHLDLDTTDLAAAALRTRAAAGLLAGAASPRAAVDATAATGETTLAASVDAVITAWAPAHRHLLTTLERLADGLAAATETFDSAERVSAAEIARALSAPRGSR